MDNFVLTSHGSSTAGSDATTKIRTPTLIGAQIFGVRGSQIPEDEGR
jgi:hypothetical protein